MYKSIKGFRAISKYELEAVLYYYRFDALHLKNCVISTPNSQF